MCMHFGSFNFTLQLLHTNVVIFQLWCGCVCVMYPWNAERYSVKHWVWSKMCREQVCTCTISKRRKKTPNTKRCRWQRLPLPLLRQRWGMKEHRNLFKNVAAFPYSTLIFLLLLLRLSIGSAEKLLSLQCCFCSYRRSGCGFYVFYYSEKHLSFGQTNVCDWINFCCHAVCVFSIFPHLTIAKIEHKFHIKAMILHCLSHPTVRASV